jgi:uncharacterized protein YpmS
VKVYRVARWCILAGVLLAVLLMLRTPAPIARPMDPEALAAHAKSYQQKITALAAADAGGQAGVEVRLTADEVTAGMSEPSTTPPAEDNRTTKAAPYQVRFENDVVEGQFTTSIWGREVWVTIAGHVSARDGYVTFTPTAFRIGRLPIPVSLVSGRLQQRLLEQREKLKLPDFVSDVRVERGELVVREK